MLMRVQILRMRVLIMDPDPFDAYKEKSLARCILKKSVSVSGKLLEAGLVVTIIACIAYLVYMSSIRLAPAAIAFGGWLRQVFSDILTAGFGVLSWIPWYVYAFAGVVLAIVVYSTLWCLAREVTPEDYAKKEVNEMVACVGITSLFVCLVGLIGTLIFTLAGSPFSYYYGGITVATFVLFAAAVDAADTSDDTGLVRNNPSPTYKAVRLPFAYHYRTRPAVQEEVPPEEVSS